MPLRNARGGPRPRQLACVLKSRTRAALMAKQGTDVEITTSSSGFRSKHILKLTGRRRSQRPAISSEPLFPFQPPASCLDFVAPLTSGSHTRLLVERWQYARQLAQLKPLTAKQLTPERIRFMKRFHHFHHGVSLAPSGSCPTAGNASFAYVVIYKSANNFINGNLDRSCPHGIQKTFDQRRFRKEVGSRRAFTFVRNPIDHFISGYTESSWRTYEHCCKNNGSSPARVGFPTGAQCMATQCPRGRQNSTNLAREFVLGLLAADEDALLSPRHVLIEPEHFFLQSGCLGLFMPSFVGRLEHFEAHWNALRGHGDLPVSFPPAYAQLKRIGRHTTSSDPFGRAAALRALLSAHSRLKQAVKALIRADYECFSYSSR